MKHLLIVLSILLLTSPVIGQETGELYQYETSSGIKWETFGDELVQPKYKGELKNRKMHGLGVLIYPYDGKSVVGEWKNGNERTTIHRKKDGTFIKWLLSGKEKEIKKDFNSYDDLLKEIERQIAEEDLKKKLRNKKSVVLYSYHNFAWGEDDSQKWSKEKKEHPNGRYFGTTHNGEPYGWGKYKYTSGSEYEGEWKKGKMHGQGFMVIMYWHRELGKMVKSERYEGQWFLGKRHGLGKETYFEDDDMYFGEWKNDKKTGHGTFTYLGGIRYEGGVMDGHFHGQGTLTTLNGEKIEGEWENSRLVSPRKKITIEYPNGSIFTGEWEEWGERSSGTFDYRDGRKYVGEFKNGYFDGKGTWSCTEKFRYCYDRHYGAYIAGEWKDNEPWKAISYDKFGKVLKEWEYGKEKK